MKKIIPSVSKRRYEKGRPECEQKALFKVDLFYRCFFLLASSAVIPLIFFYWGERINILFFLTAAVFVVASVYALTLEVETDGIDLKKKTIFGKKSIKLSDVTDLSVTNLKGRCAFFFITADSFVILSSALARFEALRLEIAPALPESCRKVLEGISAQSIEKKAKFFKACLVFLAVLLIGALIWR
jgi:hypothetical protein